VSGNGVVVVGAGVSGLTTAICLAEAGERVRVWTAEPPGRTTSALAGAMWGPSFQEPLARTLAWTEQSLRDLRELAMRPGTGVRMAPVLTVGGLPLTGRMPPQVRLIPDLRACDADELPAGFVTGFRSTMPVLDMPRYLEYLSGRFTKAGGEMEIRTVGSLAEAADAAPVVVNCAGLGARELAGDPAVRPVLGQCVAVTNPGLEEVFLELTAEPETTHYCPHPDRVLCGGITLPGRWDTAPDPGVTERILDRCRRVEPRLRHADVIDAWVGLRPDRPAVRLEAERLGRARCVHNYGHGGSGVSLSWGCAREAAALAVEDSASGT
jgi:D-amino-acid oxidase